MKIDILAVGKIKERYFGDAVDEYVKRLSRYATVNITEVKDEKTTEGASDRENELVMIAEAKRLLPYMDDKAVTIPLCIEGKQMSSEELADYITDLENSGRSHIRFVIGGSLGLDGSVKDRGDLKLSFSKMTFPHQLMRVVLLEQIYRAFRIKNNEPYHK
ncbi:MAG: 23S rRNA (pseudouridine(1915)-N(3))-methyltransferase RlmH [Lachnospiraceae bacterium]|jgi:23S rRNA (pseudouridine1915-N3)-methyltransferase|nr:23S rRNA (pseudouridine(1915)-N(3))-methyltransferase RlmH [Lachnospiraceae bacterium]